MSTSHEKHQALEDTDANYNNNIVYHIKEGGDCLILESERRKKIIHYEDVIAVINNDKSLDEDRDELLTKHSILLVGGQTEDSTRKEFAFEHYQLENVSQPILNDYCIPSRPPHLFFLPESENSLPNLYVIISVRSGTGEAERFFENVVRKAFKAVGLGEQAYQTHITESEKSITELTHSILLPRANDGVAQTILLLSGDGGIVDIVNVLLSSLQSPRYVKPAIGLVVMGTGNALANSTGLNHGMTRGLGIFLRGVPHSLPTFKASFSPGSKFLIEEVRTREPLPLTDDGFGVVFGAVVCSWALHASLVADSDTTEYRKHGTSRFQMAARELLAPSDGSQPHIYKGEVTLVRKSQDGQETQEILRRHEHMYMLATLVSNLEEKLTISPSSQPLDGQLRLVHFGAMSSTEVMRILGMAFQGGGHVGDKSVGYESIDGLRIEFDEKDSRWRRVCVDGKIIEVSEGGWMEVRKSTRDVVDIIADLQ